MLATIASVLAFGMLGSTPAIVGAAPPALLTATLGSFSVLGGTTVTNANTTHLQSNLGVSPGGAYGVLGTLVFTGTGSQQPPSNALSNTARADTTALFTTLGSAVCPSGATNEPADLTGLALVAGTYCFPAAATNLSGTLTLDAGGVADAKFIFVTASTLITSSNSVVKIINVAPSDADECNVFWEVGSSATLGTGTSFIGNIVASANIALNTGAILRGRALAGSAAVTMDTNTITNPTCVSIATSTATATPTNVPSGGGGGAPAATAVPASTALAAPTQTAIVTATATAIATLPAPTQTAIIAATATRQAAEGGITIAGGPLQAPAQVPNSLPKTGGGGTSKVAYGAASVGLLALLVLARGLTGWKERASGKRP